jgi:hypothetical protein
MTTPVPIRNRSAKIAAIRERRGESAAKATVLTDHLTRLGEGLAHLEFVRLDLMPKVDGEALDLLTSWAQLLRDLSDQVATEQALLARVLVRLRRSTLNVGVVGRARQGKSRFLQSLTGLTAREIPDGSSGFCTGVPSLIHHVPETTHADVFFHSEASFLEDVLGPYYDQYDLGRRPGSVQAFGGGRLPELPEDRRDAETESAYGHLTAYHDALPEYRKLIGAASPRRVQAEEIRSYVAQDDIAGRPLHAFRAVRRVEISTPFRQPDVAGIAVIDLPGLGDTNLGDSKVLLSALEDDVDVVIFLRRPAPEGDGIHEFDVRLYKLAVDALPEIPMERRSFLMVNHRRSIDQDLDNGSACQAFLEEVAGSPIRVVGTQTVDCSEEKEVVAAFDQVADYLLDNIASLDAMLLEERKRRTGEIDEEVRLLLKQAAVLADLAQPSELVIPLFLALFEDAYTRLTLGLQHLVRHYRSLRNKPNTGFVEAVAQVIRRAREDTGLPTPEGILERVGIEGGYVAAYAHLLDESRAHLSRHFLELDLALQNSVIEVRERTAEVFREAGLLGRLSDAQGEGFLLALIERLPTSLRLGELSEIRYALEILNGFELAYRGFIQHRIRPCLDGLNPDGPAIQLPADGTNPGEAGLLEMLQITYRQALWECEAALEAMINEPNDALFAIVEEVHDRLLRSQGTRNEWRALYMKFRAEIWTGEFAALAQETAQMQGFNDAVRRLRELVKVDQPTTANRTHR